jgi:glutamyl-tRNA synthetase
MQFKRTRIAPTPSGFLHVGNILSFSLTAALARRSGASILLRIDDLDRERVEVSFLEDIFETLRFLGIPWDEGPADVDDFERNWSQVHRMELYKRALERLRASGAVFACTCSRRQLAEAVGYPGACRDRGIPLDAPEVNWRLRTEGRGARGGRAKESALPAEMRDFVVRKKDGFPAYQLSSVVDDGHFGVDLVVRGEDLRASTEAQLFLADVLAAAGMPDAAAFGRVRFVHHPLLLSEHGEKLSKSAGATSIQYLRKQGYSAADIFALIGRLLGSEESPRDWEGLATLLFARGYGIDR